VGCIPAGQTIDAQYDEVTAPEGPDMEGEGEEPGVQWSLEDEMVGGEKKKKRRTVQALEIGNAVFKDQTGKGKLPYNRKTIYQGWCMPAFGITMFEALRRLPCYKT